MNRLLTLITFLCLTLHIQAQCTGFPATLAESDCGTGTALTSNANINSGTFSFCGTTSATTTVNSINLSGGTITVCGNLIISGGNWNSGNIIVACGATLTFSGGLTMNSNVKIVNYGRVNVTGNLEFQNSDNCFYNEHTSSRLYVSNDIIFPQNVGQNAYLKNNGYISLGGTFNARNGGYTCFGPGAQLETVHLNYGNNCSAQSNHFLYNGATGTGIIRYTGTATLNASLTTSTRYSINRGGSSTHSFPCTGSWGSAVVGTNTPAIVVPSTPGCPPTTPNCFAALPVELTGFEAIAAGSRVDTYWTTQSETNNDHFLLQRSGDADNWQTVAKIQGAGNSSLPHQYMQSDEEPLRGISYYRLVQVDTDGKKTISEVRSVIVRPENSFVLYPDPATAVINLLPAVRLRFEQIVLTDASGRVVAHYETTSSGIQILDVSDLSRGAYIVTVRLSNGFSEQRKLVLN
jgi:hypothetical protein